MNIENYIERISDVKNNSYALQGRISQARYNIHNYISGFESYNSTNGFKTIAKDSNTRCILNMSYYRNIREKFEAEAYEMETIPNLIELWEWARWYT